MQDKEDEVMALSPEASMMLSRVATGASRTKRASAPSTCMKPHVRNHMYESTLQSHAHGGKQKGNGVN